MVFATSNTCVIDLTTKPERYFRGYKTLRFFELFFELHTIHEVHKWYEKQRVTNRSNWVASLLISWVKTIPQTLITLFGHPHSKHNTHTHTHTHLSIHKVSQRGLKFVGLPL